MLIFKTKSLFRAWLNMSRDVISRELQLMAAECRLGTRSRRPDIVLARMAVRLDSLYRSIDTTPMSAQQTLTAREFEIIGHVANGFTNREMAQALDISEKTIEFHLTSIFSKMAVSGRAEAVKIASENGWLNRP